MQPLSKLYLSSLDLEAATDKLETNVQTSLSILLAPCRPRSSSQGPNTRDPPALSLQPETRPGLVGSTCWLNTSPHLFFQSVYQWCSTGAILSLTGHLAMPGDRHFCLSPHGKGMLTFLQCVGQLPTRKNDLVPKAKREPSLRSLRAGPSLGSRYLNRVLPHY